MFRSLIKSSFGAFQYDYMDKPGRNSYNVNCPKCAEDNQGPDNKYNLAILITGKKVCKCWKCGYSSSLKYLFQKYGDPDDYKTYCDFNYETLEVSTKDSYWYPKLPDEYTAFKDFDLSNELHKLAYDYLIIERSIDINLIHLLKIGACFEGYYRNRIIVPSYNKDNELTTFIGRSFDGSSPTYMGPKLDKNSYIFNENHINFNHPIFLVEGVMDMISLFINCIPLLGKVLTNSILNNIKIYNTPVFIILDEGEDDVANEMMYKLQLHGITDVQIIKVVDKDLNQLKHDKGKEFIVKNILGYTV